MNWRLPDAIGQPFAFTTSLPQIIWMILTNFTYNKLSIALTDIFVGLLALTAYL